MEKKRFSKGEVAKIILKALLISGVVVLVLSSPYASKIITEYLKGNKEKFRRSLNNLNSKKYVKLYYKNGEEVIEITEKGKKRSLSYDFEDMRIKTPKKWDGVWRIVTYDIPENRKKSRDRFVVKLKELGFYPYQKSLFVFPFQCKDEIDFMKEHIFLGDTIHYIEATHIDNEEMLQKVFGLTRC